MVRTRGVALAALVVLAAGCTGGGSDAGSAQKAQEATTTTSKPAQAGARFDDAGLPRPVSNVVVLDELVLYYAPDDGSNLELVALDPVARKVRWRHEATMPHRSLSQTIDLTATDGAVAVLTREQPDGGDFHVERVDPDGSTRWRTPIDTPHGFPTPCAKRVCVDTTSGPVSFELDTGEPEVGPEPEWHTIAESQGRTLRLEAASDANGGDLLESRPTFRSEPTWRRSSSELFGVGQVEDGSLAVHGDLWIGFLQPEPKPVQTYPSPLDHDAMAAFSVEDGAPRWKRSGMDPCGLPVSDDLVVACVIDNVQESESRWESLLTAVVGIDAASGRDRVRVDTVSYDSSEGDRVAVVGPDRLALRTPAGTREVDLRAGTAEPTDARRVAWCRLNGKIPEVRSLGGELAAFSSSAQGRPCLVDRSEATGDELMAPIVDGTLPPVAEVFAVRVGRWVLWTEDGHLEGVVTEG